MNCFVTVTKLHSNDLTAPIFAWKITVSEIKDSTASSSNKIDHLYAVSLPKRFYIKRLLRTFTARENYRDS